ncbi:MAG: (2Fe-2S) ferredoxin domain-containing protein, partial [Candidatus Zixiibacteriota bacterium]
MSDFEKKRKQAEKKWNSLKASKIPVIYIGTASCGMAAGAMEVLGSVRETLKKNRLKAKIVQVGCIGPCYLEPLMDIAVPGQPRISYANMNQHKAKRVIESYLKKGD